MIFSFSKYKERNFPPLALPNNCISHTIELQVRINLPYLQCEDVHALGVVIASLAPCKWPQILEMEFPMSKEDLVKLLEDMENSPLLSDGHTFKIPLSLIDWGKVTWKILILGRRK